MSINKDKLFTAKVEENLLSSFKHACENQDTTASQAVRGFMRDYSRKYGQADLFAPEPVKRDKNKFRGVL
uniref:hypothetical protein n=1 Tax=Psychrobacter sp. TaxID=56811 RepID=UPI00159B48D1|nr:hypothetical protein [Psychrobacter sp.]QJS05705.1 hypothetical protein [Psychrobacter sp.]